MRGAWISDDSTVLGVFPKRPGRLPHRVHSGSNRLYLGNRSWPGKDDRPRKKMPENLRRDGLALRRIYLSQLPGAASVGMVGTEGILQLFGSFKKCFARLLRLTQGGESFTQG
jgi:hypothetical protein